ncbi:uncharacterized protein LOC134210945 isoform X2 [Armigeres subalbatus]|uniref:uncharacterized protein LOC134210945 isoform X2 n=1 Tax=Armigeres subalbatus TaxID=124917 RepID=UPI002ED58680
MPHDNVYQLMSDGTTRLHTILQKGSSTELEEALRTYETDINKIKLYLEQKFAWDPCDEIWLRKTILVAVTQQQCRKAKQFENDSALRKNMEQNIFVLLLSPVCEDFVAVIHPGDTNLISAFNFIRSLMPNGFLSLNYTGIYGSHQSYIETAVSNGNIGAISKLINLGASLSLPEHNPLLPACKNLQKETIRWLLTEHFENFDCTSRNASQINAIMILMKTNDVEILDYVLLKMIAYRQKNFNESQAQAFNHIFRYEHEVYTRSSILSPNLSEPIRAIISKYIVEYELDLTYQWKGITILAELLYMKLALDYCWDCIRKRPELLGLVVRQDATIVHECIRLQILGILKETYQIQPNVKRYFETNQAFETLQQTLWNEEYDSVEFILEHHRQFFLNNIDRLKNEVIFCKYHRRSFYIKNCTRLIKHFPSLKTEIQQIALNVKDQDKDLEMALAGIDINHSQSVIKLSSIKGTNGITLVHHAVDKDNLDLLSRLLSADFDFDAVDNEGNHPIHYVQSLNMFNTLVEKHPEGQSLVNRTNFAGYSVLHKICQLRGNPELSVDLIDKAIACGADVNQLTNDGNSSLFMISNTTILETLVRHGIHLDSVNSRGQTALECNLMNRNRKMANALFRLTHRMPSFKDHAHKYFAPMIFSNRPFFTQSYRPFLEANPDTLKDLFDSVYEHSPERAAELFNKACCSGAIFVVDNFLKFDYNLNYNFRGENGCTSIVGLLNCVHGQHEGIVRRLLSKGVDLEIRNNVGRNALLTFVGRFSSKEDYEHSTSMVQLLLDNGAQLDSRDAEENNSLHLAFRRSELELVELLLQNGADFRAINCAGKTPIQMGAKLYGELFYFIS